MPTYTLQQDALTGDLFALRWHGDAITGYAGPLSARNALAHQDRLHSSHGPTIPAHRQYPILSNRPPSRFVH